MNEQKESFTFAYSAREQGEIKRIRDKYSLREGKLEKLRALDRAASSAGMAWSLLVGIVGTLIFGVGLSLTLTGNGAGLLPGIIIGVIGIAVLGLAYPTYSLLNQRAKKKYAPMILKLSEELLSEGRID